MSAETVKAIEDLLSELHDGDYITGDELKGIVIKLIELITQVEDRANEPPIKMGKAK